MIAGGMAGGLALVVAALGSLAWFHRPETAGEWAAWAQAFGVLAAIGWSVRLQQVAARQGDRHVQNVATLFATNMHWVFRELHDACLQRSAPEFAMHRRLLAETLAQGREVPLHLLGGRDLAMVTTLRSLAVEALELAEATPQAGAWSLLANHFDRRLPQIAGWLSAAGHPPESSGPTDYVGLRTSRGHVGR